MLKGISPILSPDLLKILAAMGHGDDLVIGDSNFPADALGKRCVRADGARSTDLLDAILRLFPLDTFVDAPVTLMKVVPGTLDGEPPIWNEFRGIIDRREPGKKIRFVERETFYDITRNAYATVAATETALYACLIIKKGVVSI
ncbi:MAG: fucose isomerase [Synergistaceae bacterium]|jgi:L-fucose mutarotase|nr:fucose isomerase [Synergistaceae bacterium]